MTTIATRIPVLLIAADPILRNGLRTTLHSRPELRLVDEDDSSPDTVVIVVTDRIDDTTKQALRSLQCRRMTKVVLIAGELDDADVLAAVENGVCAVARRSEVDADILVRLSTAAMSGEGVLPPDLLGRLLGRVSRLQRQVLEPRGLHIAGFTDRETEVLRLLAQGLSTSEIAKQLSYSQRTIKSIVHDVTNRFQLRNRSHAVAFAMREGLI
jgi:DNA-binding NarL/FixJ family response regulator